MEAGIKTAKSFDKDNPLGEETEKYMLVEYDEDGKPLKVVNTIQKMKSDYVYEDGKLKYVIATNSVSDVDEIKAEVRVDTLFITKNDDKGRKLEGIGGDGVKYEFSYVGCEQEATIIYDGTGVKRNMMQLFKENGNIMKRVTTFYYPGESSVTSKYIDYKFDSKGHWIERSLERQNGTIETELRVIEYY